MIIHVALELEMQTYKRELPKLSGSEGKFALVIGDKFADVYDTYEDALKEGYKQFALSPFLVKQIRLKEQVQFISREINAHCHT